MPYLKTLNADKAKSADAFITLDIQAETNIYVAYDLRASVPAWLSNWKRTDEVIKTTTGSLRLFRNQAPVGVQFLGGNDNDISMYIVVLEAVAQDTAPAAGPEEPKPTEEDSASGVFGLLELCLLFGFALGLPRRQR